MKKESYINKKELKYLWVMAALTVLAIVVLVRLEVLSEIIEFKTSMIVLLITLVVMSVTGYNVLSKQLKTRKRARSFA